MVKGVKVINKTNVNSDHTTARNEIKLHLIDERNKFIQKPLPNRFQPFSRTKMSKTKTMNKRKREDVGKCKNRKIKRDSDFRRQP